ncbi:MAG: cytochrome c [Xanthomonadales bacterium]|nr:cytochrome c [Xanthomonadales bacterium]
MLRIIATLATLSLLASTATAQNQGDPESGAKKAYTCTGCHGIPSYFNTYPMYHVPKIGGQNYDYLVAALQAYRSGDRQHPTMRAQAGRLSDEDIQDIAAYFVSLSPDEPGEPALAQAPANVPEDKLQVCVGCHGEDGIGVNPIYPKLAGQYADYMFQALKAYKSGDRNNAIMAGMVTTLSDSDMELLSAHYAAKAGLVDLAVDID